MRAHLGEHEQLGRELRRAAHNKAAQGGGAAEGVEACPEEGRSRSGKDESGQAVQVGHD